MNFRSLTIAILDGTPLQAYLLGTAMVQIPGFIIIYIYTTISILPSTTTGLRYLMDPERVPPLPQSEITSPFHSLDRDTSGNIQPDPFYPSHPNVPQTAQIDTNNFSPYAGNVPTESPSPEKSEVSEISYYHLCCL
jgi:hypothetical protein